MMRRERKRSGEPFWPKIVLKKWLNISTRDSDFSADEEVDTESEVDSEEMCGLQSGFPVVERRMGRLPSDVSTSENVTYKSRRKSETTRAQYITSRELRICVGTWNVGGKFPPSDLQIEEWIDMDEPADIYVLGLQEIVPLNAGNVLGAEDSRPVPKWESIIRETLNKIQPAKKNFKCHSDPPSPSRFRQSVAIKDELLSGSDSDSDEEVYPFDDKIFNLHTGKDTCLVYGKESECIQRSEFKENVDVALPEKLEQKMFTSHKKLDRLNQFNPNNYENNAEEPGSQQKIKLSRTLSTSEKVGLSWPEQPLNLLHKQILNNSDSFKSTKSFKASNSLKPTFEENKTSNENQLVKKLDKQSSIRCKKKKSVFVRVISKQMVGIFLSVWVRRGLRKNIQNLKVSTVGVGVMGYIGNKGSIAISMSIYQTLFCFICCHLNSGEKDGDKLRRNADVQEIHRRTLFNTSSGIGLPRTIYDHERIVWLGDLNYRINLSSDKTHELISRKEWHNLAEMDQLKLELKKGRAFDGWTEGVLTFPPTYKYEVNSENYIASDAKTGRTPAWCDRILSFGKGMKLLNYRKSELRLSDHRPVTAVYLVDVEVFDPKKLQRALTFTDSEIENYDFTSDFDYEGRNLQAV